MSGLHDKVEKAKMYQILRRGHSKLKSVNIGGKVMKFKRRIFHVRDKAVAQAIADKNPRDVMAIPHDSWREDPTGVHSYHVGLSSLGNWHDKIDWGRQDKKGKNSSVVDAEVNND